jgi:hypothetical protein
LRVLGIGVSVFLNCFCFRVRGDYLNQGKLTHHQGSKGERVLLLSFRSDLAMHPGGAIKQSTLWPSYQSTTVVYGKQRHYFLVTVAVINPDGSAVGWKTSAPPSYPSPFSSPNAPRFTGLSSAHPLQQKNDIHVMLIRQAHTTLFNIWTILQDLLEGIVQCRLYTGALILCEYL